MNKIHHILLAVTTLFVITPRVVAQTIEDVIPGIEFPEESATDYKPYTLDESKIAYKKQISSPFNDGTYWIKLESFVTGQVQVKNVSKPADVVLVLDFSNSMKTNNYTNAQGETKTRLEALKDAVNAFVQKIAINDGYEDEAGTIRRKDAQGNETTLGNRIAIIAYNREAYTIVDYQDVFANASTIQSTVTSQNPNQSNTRTDLAMTAASTMMSNTVVPYRTERKEDSSKTIVLFTDGAPASSPNEFNTTYANSAIATARTIKQSTSYDASIYVVGLVEDDDRNYTNCISFMKRVSSNYPDAISMTNPGTEAYTDDGSYFQDATKADLKAIFEAIAQESQGGAGIDLSSESVEAVDIVSASYMIPRSSTETDAQVISKIKVFTAPCIAPTGTYTEGDYLSFGTEIQAPNNTFGPYTVEDEETGETTNHDIDSDITVTLGQTSDSPNKNKINVTGFDFSTNWCGPEKDNNGNITGWHGHKLIILIPIMMDPNAVGGPSVETNGKDSGIYINGENKLKFEDHPKINLPVNFHIRKEGLKEGESAKFTIQRKLVSDPDVEESWKDVTSVFVTRHKNQAIEGENAPLTKVVGMPSTDENEKPYVYRVKEDNWSWSYTSAAATATRSDQLTRNPFIFVNTPKADIDTKVRHAESKVTNTFKTGGGAAFDDSKSNGRTVITVTAEE